MGGSWSSFDQERLPDPWWPATTAHVVGEEVKQETSQRGRVKKDELELFKQELAQKKVLRHEALAALQMEMRDLRQRSEDEKMMRVQVEQERDKLKKLLENKDEDLKKNIVEAAVSKEERKVLQADSKKEINKVEEMRAEIEKEREEKKILLEERELLIAEVEEKAGLERQIQALKDVSQIGKEMLRIRELQVKELKKKLVEINITSVMAPPEDLRVEYEKQIENIRKLRTLYEERATATLLEHRRELEREEARITVLETKLEELQKESDEVKLAKQELEEKIKTVEIAIQNKESELEMTKDELLSSNVQNKSLNTQLTLINNLFSHMLVSPSIDLDRLTRLLKENHGLITDLTSKGDSNEVAALLVDLAGQVDNEQKKNQPVEVKGEFDINIESEIASNLTKVWRVMIELLSHHQSSTHSGLAGGAESCYKCVQTPSGPRSVISVSQTFLTLKDLILEKNHLVKEVGRLKTLNNHLEHRLGSQEKRLSVVTTELRKTWGVVNKLKAQHKQLYTHEKILRYELQQKRCMLTELKQELEHCRDKWDQAREKNSQTEEDWKKLRKEFALRKSRKESYSAESGYEEEEDVAKSPPPLESTTSQSSLKLRSDVSEQEVSEDEIEQSDGNSFDTVIDLLDLACFDNQPENETASPIVLCEVPPETSDISRSLLPLTGSDFTDGLDQIESEDLAAVLDIQYQNQLIGADYNLSLPSSSGSSPIPTENDDFASSELEISEEDSSSNSNCPNPSPSMLLPNQSVPHEDLPLCSSSSNNVSKFLDGLLTENQDAIKTSEHKCLIPSIPSTSYAANETSFLTLCTNNESSYCNSTTPNVSTSSVELPVDQKSLVQEKGCNQKTEMNHHVQKWVDDSQNTSHETFLSSQTICKQQSSVEQPSACRSQEEMLKIREDRLKRLEQQCRSLVNKVTSKSFKSEINPNKMDELHFCHSSSEVRVGTVEDSNKNMLKIENESNQDFGISSFPSVLVDSAAISNNENLGCSSKNVALFQTTKERSSEQLLEARAARLKRLEDQCQSLFSKMSATSSRSELISNKLDQLHESHGSSEQSTKIPPNICSLPTAKSSFDQSGSQENHLKTKYCLVSKGENLKTPDLTSESKEVLNKCSLPGPSLEPIEISSSNYKKSRTPEQILEARAERFKRLEEQCKSLVSKMTATSLRSEIISNKLDELHSCYGSSEDASDSEDHSLEHRGRRRKPTPIPSSKVINKSEQFTENDNQAELDDSFSKEPKKLEHDLCNERLQLPQEFNSEQGKECSACREYPSGSKVTSDKTLKLQDQSLNSLGEQGTLFFNMIPATFQRSNETSNSLEERHGQHDQTFSHDQNDQHLQSSTSLTLPATHSNLEEVVASNNLSNENLDSQIVNSTQFDEETNSSNSSATIKDDTLNN